MRGNSEILDEDPKVVISLLKAKKENTGDILRMNLLIELNELNVQLGKRIETLVNFLVDCEERGGIGAINDPEIKEKFLQLHTVLEKILNFKKEIEDQIWNVLKYIKSRKIKELNSVFVEEAFILDERGKRVPYYPELNPLIKIAKSESLSWLPKEEY
jgi:hypothetical protein